MRVIKVCFQNPSFDFENRLEMYVVKNEHSFIFSIPSDSFSVKIESEQDFKHFEKFGTIFGHPDFRSELIKKMKSAMEEFE